MSAEPESISMSMPEEHHHSTVARKKKKHNGEGGNPVASDSPQRDLSTLERIFLVDLLAADPAQVTAALESFSVTVARSSNDKEAAQKIATAHGLGAEPIITGNMLKWSSEARIQELGCLGLSNILFGGGRQGEDRNPKATGEHGRAIDAIVGAMEDYPDNFNVQHWACAAFQNIACENKAGAEYIAQYEDGLALQLIIKAMGVFAGYQDIQETAIQALANLVEHEEVLQVVIQPSRIHAVMVSLSNIPVNHPAATDVMELRESTRTLLGILVDALWKLGKD